VVLGHPDAAIAEPFEVAAKLTRLVQRRATCRALAHPPEFENG
jgi:hypothetical protein